MVRVRSAIPEDVKKLQILLLGLHKTRNSHYSQLTKLFHKKLAAIPKLTARDLKKQIYLVAVNGLQVVGFVSGSIYVVKSSYVAKRGSIDELYVEENFRNQGVGQKLVQSWQRECKKQGCGIFTVKTDVENKIAQDFYLSMGMNEVTKEFWKKL